MSVLRRLTQLYTIELVRDSMPFAGTGFSQRRETHTSSEICFLLDYGCVLGLCCLVIMYIYEAGKELMSGNTTDTRVIKEAM